MVAGSSMPQARASGAMGYLRVLELAGTGGVVPVLDGPLQRSGLRRRQPREVVESVAANADSFAATRSRVYSWTWSETVRVATDARNVTVRVRTWRTAGSGTRTESFGVVR